MKTGDDIHKIALERYEEAEAHWSTIYDKIDADLKFALNIDNAQWDDGHKYEPNKLKLVINQCESQADAIINDMRASKPSINTSPVDDDADPETSQILDGLIRNIEQTSDAATAYDTAAYPQVLGGLGFIRIGTEWIEGTFNQEPKIEPVHNIKSVLMDPLTTKFDGSDQRYCFVVDTGVTKEDFESEFPDAQPIDFNAMAKGWCSDKTITIAEYFYKDTSYETIYQLSLNGELDILRGKDRKVLEEQLGYKLQKLEGQDPIDNVIRIVRERKERVDVIRWCKMNGHEILEQTEWLSRYIPVIPVYGKMFMVDGQREVSGIIKNMRDPQRLINLWESSHTETIAMQPKAPFMAYDRTIEGYEKLYEQANNKNFPVLPVRTIIENGILLPAPMRQPPQQPSPAMQSQSMMAMNHIKSVLGKIYDEGNKSLGSESGRAILAKERKADVASFHFIDNQSKSIRHAGRILIELIQKLYTEAMVMRITGEDGSEEEVEINQPTVEKKEGQEIKRIYRVNTGKYDVTVNVGPSYASKRQETVQLMLELARVMPQTMAAGADLLVQSIDGPNMDKLAKRLRKAMGIEDEEASPEQMALQQASKAVEMLQGQLGEMEKRLQDKMRSENMDYDIERRKLQLDERKVSIDEFKARIDAMKAEQEANLNAGEVQQVTRAVLEQQAAIADISQALGILLDAEDGTPTGEDGAMGESLPPIQS